MITNDASEAGSTTSEADTGETDTGETDTGETDTGETDTGETDTGETDTGETDTGGEVICGDFDSAWPPCYRGCKICIMDDRTGAGACLDDGAMECGFEAGPCPEVMGVELECGNDDPDHMTPGDQCALTCGQPDYECPFDMVCHGTSCLWPAECQQL